MQNYVKIKVNMSSTWEGNEMSVLLNLITSGEQIIKNSFCSCEHFRHICRTRRSQWLNMMKISWVKRWRTARHYLRLSLADVHVSLFIFFLYLFHMSLCQALLITLSLCSLPHMHLCFTSSSHSLFCSLFLSVHHIPPFSHAPPIFLCASSFR